jgi:hypothetical protein
MKEIYYTYNNEAIASCVFLELLQKVGVIDIARSCLILPFLLDDRTVKYFQKLSSREKIRHCPRFCVNRKLEDSSFILESCFQI